MGWWRFWDREQSDKAPTAVEAEIKAGRPRPVPARNMRNRQDPPTERRMAQLRQRQEALRYDIAQGELALQANNPWQDRIDLLSEAIATVEADISGLSTAPTQPMPEITPTPFTAIVASGGDLAQVSFTIGDEPFRFEELVDWDQRGGPTVRGDLQQVAGAVDRFVDSTLSLDVRHSLRDHFADSIVVFATDLRDRALSDEPLPSGLTLADLARPCPECGGWMNWSGRCPACVRRDIERQRLRVERDRLDADRIKEADERHRLAEGLATTRRRLSAVTTELTSLGVAPD